MAGGMNEVVKDKLIEQTHAAHTLYKRPNNTRARLANEMREEIEL